MDCSLEPLQCTPHNPRLNQYRNGFRANFRSHDSHGRRVHFIEVFLFHTVLPTPLKLAISSM